MVSCIEMYKMALILVISQSIMEYNGGSVIAMVGKHCVAIASDLRLGNQALLISSNFDKVRYMSFVLICSWLHVVVWVRCSL